MMTLDLALPTPTATHARLRQFIIYDDFTAGVAARWLASEVNAFACRRCTVTSEMWKLDMATRFGMFRAMTLQEAGEADVLIIAASDMGAPEPAFAQWLDALVPWRANRLQRGLLVGLLGAAPTGPDEFNEMTTALATFARRADLEFIWQPTAVHAIGDSGWMHPHLDHLINGRGVAS